MDLTAMTLDEFLCNSTQDVPASPTAFAAGVLALTLGMIGAKLRDVGRDQYAIHAMPAAGDVVLLHNGQRVGFYWGDVIAIDPAHQGKQLSVPLVLEAVKNRSLPATRTLSREGRQALTNAWKVANGLMEDPWP